MSDHLTVQFRLYEGDIPSDQLLWAMPKIGVLQRLDLAFEDSRWHVSGGQDGRADDPMWHGYGEHMDAAVLDWLAGRLGLKVEDLPEETGE